jgi:hypothetical protein
MPSCSAARPPPLSLWGPRRRNNAEAQNLLSRMIILYVEHIASLTCVPSLKPSHSSGPFNNHPPYSVLRSGSMFAHHTEKMQPDACQCIYNR